MSITFPKKQRKDGVGLFTDKDGNNIFVGRDYALQNEIAERAAKTRSRSCFRACHTCGCCANSRRDATVPTSFDHNAGKKIDCRGCEPFRFHDCHNGLMRDSRQEPEPFTEDQVKLINESENGKPLI